MPQPPQQQQPSAQPASAPAWPQPGPETLLPLLQRRSQAWPGLLRHAAALAASRDEPTRQVWLQAWPDLVDELMDNLAQQRSATAPLHWPEEEAPRQQVERVVRAVFRAFDKRLPNQVLPSTPYAAVLQHRALALEEAAGRLAGNPQHPALPPSGAADPACGSSVAQMQVLLDECLHRALRGVLHLRLVPAHGAWLSFVPAPANALTFCTRSFVESQATVTRLLRRWLLPAQGLLQHQALEWNLYTPESPLLAVEGGSAGAAFAVAALSLLHQHLGAESPEHAELRSALQSLAWQPGLLAQVGISIAIDDDGTLHPVGAAPEKAQAFQYRSPGRMLPVDAQHLLLHPDNAKQLDLAELPHVQVHRATTLPELLRTLARVAQPLPAFQQVLAQMPVASPPEQDDQQPPPPAAQRELFNRHNQAAWHERAQVRTLRDYCIVRWAYWAKASEGELHMRFVPLALKPAAGAVGLPAGLSGEDRPGLAHLLADIHDPTRGEDRLQALLLEGHAGAGKSTLLQRHEQALALAALRRLPGGPLASEDTGLIELPLYVPLASLDPEEPNPAAWVRSQMRALYPAFDELHQLLLGHRPPRWQRVGLRLLLDGLNELRHPPHLSRVQRAEQVVNQLCEDFKLRLAPLLSARGQHGFEALPRVQQGACVQVQPWPRDLVLRYVQRCFSETGAQGGVVVRPEGQELLGELAKPENEAVLDLCRTPFNAAGQVKLWAGGRRRLVRHRADLYRHLLHEALLREFKKNSELFLDPALITPAERETLQSPDWLADEAPWPTEGGALLQSLFTQALAQWLASDRPPEERGTVEVPWNHPRDPQRSVAAGLPPLLRSKWRRAVRELGLLADDDEGRSTGFRFRHQSWGEYLASVQLLTPTPDDMPVDQREALLQRLREGRALQRPAAEELAHQRQRADAEWWDGEPGKAWWQVLLDTPLPLSLRTVKQELGWPEGSFADPTQVPEANWNDWQSLVHDGALIVHEASDECTLTLRGLGDLFGLARFGQAGLPWAEQAACVRALVLLRLWSPWQADVRQRLAQQVGEDRARALWRSTGALALPATGSLDEVLGLALLALPHPQPWLRWLVQHGLWSALQPCLPQLQRQLEGGASAWAVARPDGVLQHLRRVLLLRQLDAGPATRAAVEQSGQWALLASRDAQCAPALHAHWQQEQVAAFGPEGRDLRERLHAAHLLGLLGDNLRYEEAPAASGNGLRLKPALWAGVGQPGRAVAHRIGAERGDRAAWRDEQPAFHTDPPLPYYQVARLPVTCAEWWAFVRGGGYNPAAPHWQQAGPAALAWLLRTLPKKASQPASAGAEGESSAAASPLADLDWANYRPPALGDAAWGWALNPVTTISAFEAVAYAFWARPLYASTAGAPAPSEPGEWRLEVPSETLWEAAQRAGPDGLPAPVQPLASLGPLDFNHAATGWNRPSPVGVFSTAYGPAGQGDGRGNVWDWCCNSLPEGPQPYNQRGSTASARADWDGSDEAADSARALRGGAFSLTSDRCRPSVRGRGHPGNHVDASGVRLVRVFSPHLSPRTP